MKYTALAVLLSIAGSAVHAGTITEFNDFTSFDNATGALTVEDFGDDAHFPISSGILNSATTEAGIQAGDIAAGVTFSTQIGTGNFFNIDAGGSYSGGFLDSVANDPNQTLTVTFDVAQSGFGFLTGQFMTAFDLTINFAGGGSFSTSGSTVGQALSYFGYTSDAQDILSLEIDGTSGGFPFALDDFAFTGEVNAAPIPLPAGLPLLAVGVLGFGLIRRFKA